jgi:hypothetical protein
VKEKCVNCFLFADDKNNLLRHIYHPNRFLSNILLGLQPKNASIVLSNLVYFITYMLLKKLSIIF